MSGWGSWFGGGGQKKRDAPKNAILQLRSTMEMLNKREKHLQNQIDDQDTLARKYINTNKARTYDSRSQRVVVGLGLVGFTIYSAISGHWVVRG